MSLKEFRRRKLIDKLEEVVNLKEQLGVAEEEVKQVEDKIKTVKKGRNKKL